MRILHFSDSHLPAEAGLDGDGIDAREVLEQLLHDCRHVVDLDAVVVSGDIADDGSEAAYRDAFTMVSGYAAKRNAAQIFCVGNHDERKAFSAVLGTGHHHSSGGESGRLLLDEGCCAAISDLDRLRPITLDSLVPGHTHGHLG